MTITLYCPQHLPVRFVAFFFHTCEKMIKNLFFICTIQKNVVTLPPEMEKLFKSQITNHKSQIKNQRFFLINPIY